MASKEKDPPSESADGQSGEDYADKRQHPRAPLTLLVQYRFETFDDFLFEYSSDISLGGMFIRTSVPRPEGSMIYLQFALRDGSKLIEGLARVVHVTPSGTDRVAGMGVEFVNFDEESIELIEEIVSERLDRRDDGQDRVSSGVRFRTKLDEEDD